MNVSERRARQLEAAFQAGWDDAADAPPLTERQIERLAFLIAPAVATPRTAPKQTTPLADAA